MRIDVRDKTFRFGHSLHNINWRFGARFCLAFETLASSEIEMTAESLVVVLVVVVVVVVVVLLVVSVSAAAVVVAAVVVLVVVVIASVFVDVVVLAFALSGAVEELDLVFSTTLASTIALFEPALFAFVINKLDAIPVAGEGETFEDSMWSESS